jgi:hypothetical protein
MMNGFGRGSPNASSRQRRPIHTKRRPRPRLVTSNEGRRLFAQSQAAETRPPSSGGDRTPPRISRGWVGGTGYPVTRSDLAVARRAIKEDWPAPAPVRAAVIADIRDVALADDAPLRVQLSAVRTIVDAEAVNQRADHAERATRGRNDVADRYLDGGEAVPPAVLLDNAIEGLHYAVGGDGIAPGS